MSITFLQYLNESNEPNLYSTIGIREFFFCFLDNLIPSFYIVKSENTIGYYISTC